MADFSFILERGSGLAMVDVVSVVMSREAPSSGGLTLSLSFSSGFGGSFDFRPNIMC